MTYYTLLEVTIGLRNAASYLLKVCDLFDCTCICTQYDDICLYYKLRSVELL